ncbi:MAG TPA: hypothetical protein VFF82_00005, partial [Rhodocyclaceae bacterium]|nr:hypothetical protein [Rhodocyclaceae bacterium]
MITLSPTFWKTKYRPSGAHRKGKAAVLSRDVAQLDIVELAMKRVAEEHSKGTQAAEEVAPAQALASVVALAPPERRALSSWQWVPALAALIMGIGLGWWVGSRMTPEQQVVQLP